MKAKSTAKGFAPILILILLVLVAFGVYVFKFNKNKQLTSPSPVTTPTEHSGRFTPGPIPINDIIKAEANTISWKTYKIKNFELRYPATWEVRDVFPNMPGNDTSISNLRKNGESINGECGSGSFPGDDVVNMKPVPIKLGNVNWEIRRLDWGGYVENDVGYDISSFIYSIGNISSPTFACSFAVPRSSPPDLPIINQILSTFHFLK